MPVWARPQHQPRVSEQGVGHDRPSHSTHEDMAEPAPRADSVEICGTPVPADLCRELGVMTAGARLEHRAHHRNPPDTCGGWEEAGLP